MNRVLFSSLRVDWGTPQAVYARLDQEFHFNYDPCPIGGDQDGLATLFATWRGKRVYCNPPYGRSIGRWLERGLEAELAVFLLPARTDTRWFHDTVLPKAKEIRFIRGRLRFGNAQAGAPFPNMIVIFAGMVALTPLQAPTAGQALAVAGPRGDGQPGRPPTALSAPEGA